MARKYLALAIPLLLAPFLLAGPLLGHPLLQEGVSEELLDAVGYPEDESFNEPAPGKDALEGQAMGSDELLADTLKEQANAKPSNTDQPAPVPQAPAAVELPAIAKQQETTNQQNLTTTVASSSSDAPLSAPSIAGAAGAPSASAIAPEAPATTNLNSDSSASTSSPEAEPLVVGRASGDSGSIVQFTASQEPAQPEANSQSPNPSKPASSGQSDSAKPSTTASADTQTTVTEATTPASEARETVSQDSTASVAATPEPIAVSVDSQQKPGNVSTEPGAVAASAASNSGEPTQSSTSPSAQAPEPLTTSAPVTEPSSPQPTSVEPAPLDWSGGAAPDVSPSPKPETAEPAVESTVPEPSAGQEDEKSAPVSARDAPRESGSITSAPESSTSATESASADQSTRPTPVPNPEPAPAQAAEEKPPESGSSGLAPAPMVEIAPAPIIERKSVPSSALNASTAEPVWEQGSDGSGQVAKAAPEGGATASAETSGSSASAEGAEVAEVAGLAEVAEVAEVEAVSTAPTSSLEPDSRSQTEPQSATDAQRETVGSSGETTTTTTVETTTEDSGRQSPGASEESGVAGSDKPEKDPLEGASSNAGYQFMVQTNECSDSGLSAARLNSTLAMILERLDKNCSHSLELLLKPSINEQIKDHIMETSAIRFNLDKLFSPRSAIRAHCLAPASSGQPAARLNQSDDEISVRLVLEFESRDGWLEGNWRHYRRFSSIDEIPIELSQGSSPAMRRLRGSSSGEQPFTVASGQFRLGLLGAKGALELRVRMRRALATGSKELEVGSAKLERFRVDRMYLDRELGIESPLSMELATVQVLHDGNRHHRRNNWLLDLYANWLAHEYRRQLDNLLTWTLAEQVNEQCLLAPAA